MNEVSYHEMFEADLSSSNPKVSSNAFERLLKEHVPSDNEMTILVSFEMFSAA